MARQATHRPADGDHRGYPKRPTWSPPVARVWGRTTEGRRHSSMHKSLGDSSCENKTEESRVSVSVFEEKQSWRRDQHWVGLMTESFEEEVSSE